jgi:hypothetical protein
MAEQISKRYLLIRKEYSKDSSSRCASVAVAGNPAEVLAPVLAEFFAG